MDKTKSSNPKDFLSLVKLLYRDKGIRPLSKAMAEASRQWKKSKKETRKAGL